MLSAHLKTVYVFLQDLSDGVDFLCHPRLKYSGMLFDISDEPEEINYETQGTKIFDQYTFDKTHWRIDWEML